MTLYAILYWMSEEGSVEIWKKVYQTERHAEIVLDALKYYDVHEGIVVPLELVTV